MWLDSAPNTSSFRFQVKMPKRTVAPRQMPPPKTADQPDDEQHNQEKGEPSQPQKEKHSSTTETHTITTLSVDGTFP